MATPISYGIGISDQNLQAMLNSDIPEIREEAENYLAAAQQQQPEKTNFLQKIGNFFFPPAAGAEPDFNVITGEPNITTNQFPFRSMADMAATNDLALSKMFSVPSKTNYSVAPVPPASASTMFQDLYYPNSGIMSQAPGRFLDDAGLPPIDTSFGVANEPDDEDDINKTRETRTGIAKLFEFLQGLPTPMNLLRGGLQSLGGFNQRLRNTDFGQSRTGAEYMMRRRERKQAERAQEAMPEVYRSAKEQGFTNDRGGFSTSRADRAGTSAGSGQFSSRRSTGRQGY